MDIMIECSKDPELALQLVKDNMESVQSFAEWYPEKMEDAALGIKDEIVESVLENSDAIEDVINDPAVQDAFADALSSPEVEQGVSELLDLGNLKEAEAIVSDKIEEPVVLEEFIPVAEEVITFATDPY
jgi:hypothetical protein